MLALSIRQPFAEMILRGIKTAEYRTRPTKLVGQRFWIYASRGGGDWRKRADGGPLAVGGDEKANAWSLDLSLPKEYAKTLPWMAELANALELFPEALPTGVIVGSAVIEKVTPFEGTLHASSDGSRALSAMPGKGTLWRWHLADVQRAKRCRKPIGHPQPVWFRAFS